MAKQQNQSMISETSICNQALSWLGHDRIDSLDQPISTAEWCRDNYQFLRDAVLEEHMWTFATVRASSGPVTETAEHGGYFVHNIPLGWLKVFRVFRDANGNALDEWYLEGRQILSRCDTIYMWGIERVTDTGRFTNMFVQCLAHRMAADMAIPLTANENLAQMYYQKYLKCLDDAAARDGQQSSNEQLRHRRLVPARSGRRGYGLRGY